MLKKIDEVVIPWMWRDKTGNTFHPSQMHTRHLYYTLRMIWNHSMPMKFEPYRRYKFSSHYTNEYMATAVRELATELATRTGLTTEMKTVLEAMIEYLKKPQIGRNNEKAISI